MKDEIISFQVAKLAKEKGFQELCLNYYFEDGEFRENLIRETHGYYGDEYTVEYDELIENWNTKWLTRKSGDRCFGCSKDRGYLETYSAPTQSLLQRWLREVHDIHISIILRIGTKRYRCRLDYIIDDSWKNDIAGIFDTYEQALEVGLLESLKLINNGE